MEAVTLTTFTALIFRLIRKRTRANTRESKSEISILYHDYEQSAKVRMEMVLDELSGRQRVKRLNGLGDISTGAIAVWENTPTRAVAKKLNSVAVYNHLSAAAEIFGNKANLAILSQSMKCPTIRSYVFETASAFGRWCRRLPRRGSNEAEWVAKIPDANSGSGIWVIGESNRVELSDEIMAAAVGSSQRKKGCVVIQEYVRKPLLWEGRKLQFRVYFAVKGDLSCWICRNGLMQVYSLIYFVLFVRKPTHGFDCRLQRTVLGLQQAIYFIPEFRWI